MVFNYLQIKTIKFEFIIAIIVIELVIVKKLKNLLHSEYY